VGVELAQFFRRFGAAVTLVESGERLIAREEARMSELIADVLREEGVDVRLSARIASVAFDGSARIVRFEDGSRVRASELVIASGRNPRVEGLGLEALGTGLGEDGLQVDHRCCVAEGVWAIGDVTGVMPFTHVAKYQARVVARDIAGERVVASYGAIPRVTFCDPELAAVGLSEQQARERGIDVTCVCVELSDAIARPSTYEREPRGMLGLVGDRRRRVLVGAWAAAPLAGEWIHQAALAIKAKVPLRVLRDTVAQFPTFSEAYLAAFEQLDGQSSLRRSPGGSDRGRRRRAGSSPGYRSARPNRAAAEEGHHKPQDGERHAGERDRQRPREDAEELGRDEQHAAAHRDG
jgi:dihydrolipoamide dehydrogenase